ncbi:hypothetical protein ACJA25_01070 [Mycoplasmopsis hyopharyngis]|uniref:hypothetical protein n=1 Tax=Mycoplasmopsis hyopharyngis TaxID=29558 RepID=UPI00387394C1
MEKLENNLSLDEIKNNIKNGFYENQKNQNKQNKDWSQIVEQYRKIIIKSVETPEIENASIAEMMKNTISHFVDIVRQQTKDIFEYVDQKIKLHLNKYSLALKGTLLEMIKGTFSEIWDDYSEAIIKMLSNKIKEQKDN